MKKLIMLMLSCAIMLTFTFKSVLADDSEITIAYFLEWPTPNQYDQGKNLVAKALGVEEAKWRAFGNGNEMSAAMAAGDVQIAYSQGLVPFVLAVNEGLPIKLVSIAVSYAENDNCVVHKDAGITKANAKDLEGKKVATPIGNVTHYKFLKSMEHLNVDVSKIQVIKMNPNEGAAAMARGDVAMACGFGGGLVRMKDYGKVLLTAKEQEAIGIRVFDVVSVTEEFAQNHPDKVVKFLQMTEDANRNYKTAGGSKRTDILNVVSKAAGMSKEDTIDTLNKFAFPNRDQQLSQAWMGGTVQSFIKSVADFYVAQGTIDKALR